MYMQVCRRVNTWCAPSLVGRVRTVVGAGWDRSIFGTAAIESGVKPALEKQLREALASMNELGGHVEAIGRPRRLHQWRHALRIGRVHIGTQLK